MQWKFFLTILAATFFGVPAKGETNEIVAELNATKELPRKSEGDFIQLKTGKILFFYTEFYGGRGDHNPARIVSISSEDRGRSWSDKSKVEVENQGEQNVMSVSLLRFHSGKIALFYLVKNGFHDCRPRMQLSEDEAQTWSAAMPVIAAPGYFVLNNDRVVQLESGRLIAPVAFHRQRAASKTSANSFDRRAIALWYLSDDEGKSWRESETWWALPAQTTTGMQEPGVVELSNGDLWSWARTDQKFQFACLSTNRGNTWSIPEATTLRSPISPASIKRLPGSPDLLAIYNDVSGVPAERQNRRTPLVAAISKDNGKTWPLKKVLEDDPGGWFCYTAIEFVDDAVLLAYSAGSSKEKLNSGLNRTRIRRTTLDWLLK